MDACILNDEIIQEDSLLDGDYSIETTEIA